MPKNLWNNDDVYTFDISLIIESEKKSVDKVIEQLGFTEYLVTKKGDKRSRVAPPTTKNRYIYTRKTDDLNKYQENILFFLKDLLNKKKEIINIKEEYDVRLRVFYQSNYAQMYFEFTEDMFEILSKLNLSCEVSILSWGGVGDI